MAQHYKRTLGLKKLEAVVLPNWTDPQMFDPESFDREKLREKFGYKKDEKVIFFLHEMEKGKGPQYLPQIVKEVASSRKGVKFLFAGDGRLRKEVEKQIHDLGFSSIVHFPGALAHMDVPDYYAVSDIYIMPSLFEAFSRCLLEAMAIGLPFVASDGGCNSTFAYTPKEQHPFIIQTDKMNTFPSLVLELLENQELSQKLSSVNRQFVEDYTFDNAIKRFEKAILE
jgi:glycosyltransferase involved in cell wall biosynthesis